MEPLSSGLTDLHSFPNTVTNGLLPSTSRQMEDFNHPSCSSPFNSHDTVHSSAVIDQQDMEIDETGGNEIVVITLPQRTAHEDACPSNAALPQLPSSLPNSNNTVRADSAIYEEVTIAHCIECDKLVDVTKDTHKAVDCVVQKELSCVHCSQRFNYEQNLRVHLVVEHSNQDTFNPGRDCQFCDPLKRGKKCFQRFHAYIAHIRSHSKPDEYFCTKCDAVFQYPSMYSRHCRLVHGINGLKDRRRFSSEVGYCPKCNKLIDMNKVDIHRLTHAVHQTIDKKTSNKGGSILAANNIVNHKFQCEKCEKSFRRPVELQRHQAVHEDILRWACSMCNKKFVHESGLRSHKKTAHSNTSASHTCRICGISFAKASNVARHVKVAHPLESANQLFDCPKCPCQFRSSRSLQRHLNQEHKGEVRVVHRCTICLRVFDKKGTLTRHMKSHVSEADRPFKCNRCDMRYKLRSSLKLHMDVHARKDVGDPVLTDPKCPICMKHLSSSTNLRKHMLTHQNGYECPDCLQRFATLHRLDRHQCFPVEPPTSNVGILELSAEAQPLYQAFNTDGNNQQVTPAKSYYCKQCPSSFYSFKAFKEHKSLHLGLRPHICWTCHKSFRTAEMLAQHKEIHSREPIYCEFCHKILHGRVQYSQHIAANHRTQPDETSTPNYPNRAMGAFSTQSYPDADLTGRELAESLFATRAQSADNHGLHELPSKPAWHDSNATVETVADRSIRCCVCLHMYSSIAYLVQHFLNCALDQLHSFAVIQCPLCDCSLRGASEAANHITNSHPYMNPMENHTEMAMNAVLAPSTENIAIRQPQRRPHQCSECQFAFVKKSDLERHSRTHTDERPFGCDVCGRAFRVKSTLIAHIQTHDRGAPQNQCSVCNETFYTKNALVLHLRIHSGEKPLKCRYCPSSFRSSALRQSHEKAEHGIASTHKCTRKRCGICAAQKRNTTQSTQQGVLPEYDNEVCNLLFPVRKLPLDIMQEQPNNVMNTIAQFSRIAPGVLEPASGSAFTAAQPQQPPPNRAALSASIHITAKRVTAVEYSVTISLFPPKAIREGIDSSSSMQMSDFQNVAAQHANLRITLMDGQILEIEANPVLKALGDDTLVRLRAKPCDGLTRSVKLLPAAHTDFCDRCDICEVDLPSKQLSDEHFASEDHETAQVLHPLSSAVQDTMDTLMIPAAIPINRKTGQKDFTCKLCGQKYPNMEPLVAHIRRDHERDHPHSFAPRPAARTAPPLERDRID